VSVDSAVPASGSTAVLSHRAALALWELRPRPAGPIDVTVVARGRRPLAGIQLHCVRSLDAADRMTIDAIPVTPVARALLDYAEVARPQQLRLAVEAADRRELLDLGAVRALLSRSPGRHGARPLAEVIEQLTGPAPWTQSQLERHFLALVRAARLPEPQCNVIVEGELVDFFWPDARLIVETDGFEFHRHRAQFEADRRRDARLQAAGFRVVRITQWRLKHEPGGVVAELRRLLSRPG
jgi:very-short-patch-repair endonuclease